MNQYGFTGGGRNTLGTGAGLLLSSLIGGLGQGISNWITRKREDTAVQRRAADMEAAGINPTLAAGAPAQAQPLKGALTEGAEKAALAMSLMKMKADVGLANAQRANVEADTAAKNLANQYSQDTMSARTQQAIALSVIDESRARTENQVIHWVDKDGTVSPRSVAEIRALSLSYDANLKRLEGRDRDMALALKEQFVNSVLAGKVQNPAILEAMAKALTVELLKKENLWYLPGRALQLGTSLAGMMLRY